MRSLVYIAALSALTLLLSCSHLDDPPACGGIAEYQSGDSLVVCFSDSAVAYVGSIGAGGYVPNHYSIDAYLFREYRIARDPYETSATSTYSGNFASWRIQSWALRSLFLPEPFTRDIAVADSGLLLYQIAAYPEQFGFGWVDTFVEDVDLYAPETGHIWFNDNPETVRFDGHSDDYERFLSLLVYLR